MVIALLAIEYNATRPPTAATGTTTGAARVAKVVDTTLPIPTAADPKLAYELAVSIVFKTFALILQAGEKYFSRMTLSLSSTSYLEKLNLRYSKYHIIVKNVIKIIKF